MDTMKSLFSKGQFDDQFTAAAKRELPALWGRLDLLEEFYSLEAPGTGERARMLHDMIGRPKRFHGSTLRKLWTAITVR